MRVRAWEGWRRKSSSAEQEAGSLVARRYTQTMRVLEKEAGLLKSKVLLAEVCRVMSIMILPMGLVEVRVCKV